VAITGKTPDYQSDNPSDPRDFAVAFDLDGTLYSSEEILGPAYADAVAEANAEWGTAYRVPTTPEILALVGRPVREIMKLLYPEMPGDHIEAFSTRTLEQLVGRIRRRGGHVFDGVAAMLSDLAGREHPLLLVSNCRRPYLESILETFALADFFETAVCNEDAPELGKSGLLVQILAGRRGVMVGDRASDGEAARFARIPWIGCRYGHAGSEAVGAELDGADAVADSVLEIPALVESLANR
jgi:phosphoglycolate phosphatase